MMALFCCMCGQKKDVGILFGKESGEKYHAVARFDVVGEENSQAKRNTPPNYTSVFAEQLIKQAEKDNDIMAITAAMPSGTGIDHFARRFHAEVLMLVLPNSTRLPLRLG